MDGGLRSHTTNDNSGKRDSRERLSAWHMSIN